MKFLNVHSISIAFMFIYKKVEKQKKEKQTKQTNKQTNKKMFSYIISVHTDWLNYI